MTLNQYIYISDSHKNSEKKNKQTNVLQSDKQPIYKTLQIVFFFLKQIIGQLKKNVIECLLIKFLKD